MSNSFVFRMEQFNISTDSCLTHVLVSRHEIVSVVYPVLKMILIDSRNRIKNLRFEDNQKAVSNAHNPHQEVRERQPEIQPSNRAFIIVVAIKEDRVLCQALKSNNKATYLADVVKSNTKEKMDFKKNRMTLISIEVTD